MSSRAKRLTVMVGALVVGSTVAVVVLAPTIGASVRDVTGNVPAMAVESYDGSFDSVVGGTDRLVGAAAIGALITLALAGLAYRWRKLAAVLVLVLGLVTSGVTAITAAGAYDREAKELILDGMCNGGQGSTGHTTLNGRRVDYGLNRACDSLVIWSGTTEIRTIPAPGDLELDLHVVGTKSRQGHYFVAAGTMAEDQGGPYTLVIFQLDENAEPRAFDLRAPDSGQGFPILGEHGLFQFERAVNGEGMVTAVDPDTGDFEWNVTCPSGWDYLLFAYDGMIDARGTGDTVSCVQDAANNFRSYELDTEAGRLGAVIEDRPWRQ